MDGSKYFSKSRAWRRHEQNKLVLASWNRSTAAVLLFSRYLVVRRIVRTFLSILVVLCFAGCSVFEDEATSIAYDIERGVRHLGNREGSTHVINHDARSRAGVGTRTIKVQFDKVGALIVWYLDADGNVMESGSTTYHSRFVDTPETIIVDVRIESPLNIEVHRRNGRATVVRVW